MVETLNRTGPIKVKISRRSDSVRQLHVSTQSLVGSLPSVALAELGRTLKHWAPEIGAMDLLQDVLQVPENEIPVVLNFVDELREGGTISADRAGVLKEVIGTPFEFLSKRLGEFPPGKDYRAIFSRRLKRHMDSNIHDEGINAPRALSDLVEAHPNVKRVILDWLQRKLPGLPTEYVREEAINMTGRTDFHEWIDDPKGLDLAQVIEVIGIRAGAEIANSLIFAQFGHDAWMRIPDDSPVMKDLTDYREREKEPENLKQYYRERLVWTYGHLGGGDKNLIRRVLEEEPMTNVHGDTMMDWCRERALSFEKKVRVFKAAEG